MARARLSILDLAPVGRGETASDSFAASVALAQRAEALGYERVWYAEHHNFATIASSATSVLIAHVGAHTRTIRLGAGGVMLPNHAPLVIAEQFGTLAAMYPDRIDLGLGRAPGTDQATMHALRRALQARPTPSPRTSSSCRATSPGTAGSPASRPSPARARTSRSTSSGRRCSGPSWPPPSACPTRSPPTSPRLPCKPLSPPTAASSDPPSNSTAPT